mgnify:CR=1 FL=1
MEFMSSFFGDFSGESWSLRGFDVWRHCSAVNERVEDAAEEEAPDLTAL